MVNTVKVRKRRNPPINYVDPIYRNALRRRHQEFLAARDWNIRDEESHRRALNSLANMKRSAMRLALIGTGNMTPLMDRYINNADLNTHIDRVRGVARVTKGNLSPQQQLDVARLVQRLKR